MVKEIHILSGGNMKLKGNVALITGASKGIGRSIAVELAKEGAMVAVNYNKDREGSEETIRIIESFGGYAIGVKGDVSKYKDVENMISKIVDHYGKIDILINNAGISIRNLFMDMKLEEIDNLINVNLKGVMYTCHCVLPYMASKGHGRIVNISSIWGNVGGSCESVYSASKGAINSFTKALGKEMALNGIRVNAISPGVIDTGMNNWLSEEEKNELKEEISVGEFGKGEDIGKVAAFLCSEDAKYINSQVITVDGGMY